MILCQEDSFKDLQKGFPCLVVYSSFETKPSHLSCKLLYFAVVRERERDLAKCFTCLPSEGKNCSVLAGRLFIKHFKTEAVGQVTSFHLSHLSMRLFFGIPKKVCPKINSNCY